MRTLDWDEIEQVGGGGGPLLVAIVPIIQAAVPIVTTVAAAATTIAVAAIGASAIKRGLDNAAELCKNGSDATVKSPTVDMSCSGKSEPASGTKASQAPSQPAGMLKAWMPESVAGY